jgi:CheY-like chemotaxis protein
MTPRRTVLVVENDQSVREAVALALSYVGYEVVLAESGKGEEALVLMAEAGSLDGLFTDIELDGRVNGWEVGERFRLLWPLKPIVYATAGRAVPRSLLSHETFLRKPFDLSVLGTALDGTPEDANTSERQPDKSADSGSVEQV